MNIYYLRRQLKKRKTQKHYEVKPIGSALKLRRQELRLTLEEGAEGICSISYLSKLENNQIEPNPEFVERLSKRMKMKEHGHYDHDDYEKDLKLITEWMIHKSPLDTTLLDKYQSREDHQALLIKLMFDVMNARISIFETRYDTIKQFIPHFTQDELSLLIFCLSEVLYAKHQYKLAHQVILELPHEHAKNFDHYLLSLRLRLLASYKLHFGAEIIAIYHEYLNLLSNEGYYHLIEEIKREHIEYLAWYQSPRMIRYKSKMRITSSLKDDYALAISYFRHQSYDQVIELAKRQETTHKWRILLLLTYDKMHQLEALSQWIDSMEQSIQNPSEKMISQYLKHKHFSTKEIMLRYLRRDILDAQLPTDDYFVNAYIMMDAQHIFSKSQFYKEASQLIANYQRRMNQMLWIEPSIEDED